MRATAPLERAAKMHTTEAVDEERYARYMEGAALAWSDEDRRLLLPILSGLAPLLPSLKWRPAKPVLLVKAAADFEDGLPHTRANAIVLQESVLQSAPAMLAAVLAHELFHIISRDDPRLREELYAAIGFKPCASVEIPEAVARLRVSNPDAPQHRRRSPALPELSFREDRSPAGLQDAGARPLAARGPRRRRVQGARARGRSRP